MQRIRSGKAVLDFSRCGAGGSLRRMSTRTTVMSFGDGSHGALGLPSSLKGIGIGGEDAYEPSRVPKLPPDVSSVSAGHYHSLAITSQGQLWAWGRNHEAQLGRGPSSSRDSCNEPMRVQGLDRVTVCSSYASGVISAAIGDDGSLWVWGKSKRGQLGLGKNVTEAMMPTRVESLVGEKIAKVSFGWGHALAKTEDGKLYGWGYSADGRLGKADKSLEVSFVESSQNTTTDETRLSDSAQELAEKLVSQGMEKEKEMPIIWEPLQLEEVDGVEAVDISCGLDHSLVLCRNGNLLSGGSNIYGQLGREQQDIGLFPLTLSSTPPVSIGSGLGHSLVICRAGSLEGSRSVLSWGWNQSSQLGRAGPEDVPMEVEGLTGEHVTCVSGGRVHSVAVTSKRELWVWGCGRNGRLGLGSSFDEAEPMLVEGVEVLQAVCGFDHTLLLVAE